MVFFASSRFNLKASMYIGDWLARREMLTPDKVALIDAQHDYRSITYREWNR